MSKGLFPQTEQFFKELFEASKEFKILNAETIGNEKEWVKGQIMREKLMAKLDGIPMTDEDIQLVVEIQRPTNPHRMKLEAAEAKLWGRI